MAEFKIEVDIPQKFEKEFKSALAKLVNRFTKGLKLQILKERLDSEEEKDLRDWAVKMGRKLKKDMTKRAKKEDKL